MTKSSPKLPTFWLNLLTFLIYLLSVCFIVGGIWNVIIGGPYVYAIAGLLLLGTGILFSKRNAVGLVIYGILFIGMCVWTVGSSSINIWNTVPRLDLFLLLAVLMYIPCFTRPLFPNLFAFVPLTIGTISTVGVMVAGLFYDPMNIDGTLPDRLLHPLSKVAAEIENSDWTSFGRTTYGDHFSPVDLINKENVSNLKPAWTARTGDLPLASDPVKLTNEATPISLGGQLYTCTAHQKLVSVDGKTGEIKWTFDPELDTTRSFQHLTCRGVSAFITPENALTSTGEPAPQECPKRILLGTNDGRLFAINAENGEQCHSFGRDGVVDLRFAFQPDTKVGQFEPTSPALIAGNIAVVNGAVSNNYPNHESSGVTRAYDVYTGRLLWVFDGANSSPNEMPGNEHPHYQQKSPNSWSISSYDPELNLIYMPMGIAAPDQWGGGRNTDAERYAPGVVALNASNGHVVWSFRSVHHDLWNQDAPAQPVLMDTTDSQGITRKALYLPTKSGDIFVLDRETGEPIVPIKEIPAPGGAATGDWTASTQPASELTVGPTRPIIDEDIWGASLLDQMVCTGYFHSLRYNGPWTPPSFEGSLVYPGDLGVFEWGGMSVDPRKQIAFANINEMPFVSRLVKRDPSLSTSALTDALQDKNSSKLTQANFGSPYGVQISPFMNPILKKIGIKVPCYNPPWGENVGIDLTANKVVWRHRSGTVKDAMHKIMPLPALRAGVPSIGGSLTTAGGLTFVSGTKDDFIRAYDTQTGKELWSARLPAGGQATPMTYELDGKQYVVVYAGGHEAFGTHIGDYLVAYTLPDRG